MNCDGAIRLMLVEAGEGDEGSNWFIRVCSGGALVGFFFFFLLVCYAAKRCKDWRPWLVFLTPVDTFNQKKSLGEKWLIGKDSS